MAADNSEMLSVIFALTACDIVIAGRTIVV